MDETWLYHNDPETKQQSMEWRNSGSPLSKYSECKNPLEKFSPRFFWDQDGILLIGCLPKGQTIKAEYYSFLLVQLKDILKEKTPQESHKGCLALARQCLGSPATCNPKLAYLCFQCLDNPPYSPDLSQSDYHLFPGLKKN